MFALTGRPGVIVREAVSGTTHFLERRYFQIVVHIFRALNYVF
jgi:hypothetical protein